MQQKDVRERNKRKHGYNETRNARNRRGRNTSRSRNTTPTTDASVKKVMNAIPFRLLNHASTVSPLVVVLVNNLSFTQNWNQPLMILLAATPIVIQSLVFIYLVRLCLRGGWESSNETEISGGGRESASPAGKRFNHLRSEAQELPAVSFIDWLDAESRHHLWSACRFHMTSMATRLKMARG